VTPPAAGTGWTFGGSNSATFGSAYTFTITVLTGYAGTPAVAYTIGGTAGAQLLTPTVSGSVYTFTILAASVTGNIVIGTVSGITPKETLGIPISTAAEYIALLYDTANLDKDFYLTNDIDFEGERLPNRLAENGGRAADANGRIRRPRLRAEEL